MIRCGRCDCWIDTEMNPECSMCGWEPGLTIDFAPTKLEVAEIGSYVRYNPKPRSED